MSTKNLVELPNEAEFGPAMRALPNDRWRRFVIACNQPDVRTGGVNYTQAAEDAGYNTTNRKSLGVIAHTLAHDERIQAAMLEESKRRVGAALPIATAAIIGIISNPLAKASDILKAAGMLMDRGGMPMTTEHNVNVAKIKSQTEQIADAVKLCKELGLDPAVVLGNIGISMPKEITVQHAGPPGSVIDIDAEIIELVPDPYLKDFE